MFRSVTKVVVPITNLSPAYTNLRKAVLQRELSGSGPLMSSLYAVPKRSYLSAGYSFSKLGAQHMLLQSLQEEQEGYSAWRSKLTPHEQALYVENLPAMLQMVPGGGVRTSFGTHQHVTGGTYKDFKSQGELEMVAEHSRDSTNPAAGSKFDYVRQGFENSPHKSVSSRGSMTKTHYPIIGSVLKQIAAEAGRGYSRSGTAGLNCIKTVWRVDVAFYREGLLKFHSKEAEAAFKSFNFDDPFVTPTVEQYDAVAEHMYLVDERGQPTPRGSVGDFTPPKVN